MQAYLYFPYRLSYIWTKKWKCYFERHLIKAPTTYFFLQLYCKFQSNIMHKVFALVKRWSFFYNKNFARSSNTVWSERFSYKVAPPELKISPIMYFVIHNSVVLSKILKIIVPFWLLFVYVDYYQNNQFYRVKIDLFIF